VHGDHVDEHVLAVSKAHPADCTSGHPCGGHASDHQHGTPCDDHGRVSLAKSLFIAIQRNRAGARARARARVR
jgi:hypothetical protein